MFQLRSQLENDLLDAQSRIEDLEKLLKAQGKVRHCQVQSNLRGRYFTPMYFQALRKMHVLPSKYGRTSLGQEVRFAFRPLCSVVLDSAEILLSITPYTGKQMLSLGIGLCLQDTGWLEEKESMNKAIRSVKEKVKWRFYINEVIKCFLRF